MERTGVGSGWWTAPLERLARLPAERVSGWPAGWPVHHTRPYASFDGGALCRWWWWRSAHSRDIYSETGRLFPWLSRLYQWIGHCSHPRLVNFSLGQLGKAEERVNPWCRFRAIPRLARLFLLLPNPEILRKFDNFTGKIRDWKFQLPEASTIGENSEKNFGYMSWGFEPTTLWSRVLHLTNEPKLLNKNLYNRYYTISTSLQNFKEIKTMLL